MQFTSLSKNTIKRALKKILPKIFLEQIQSYRIKSKFKNCQVNSSYVSLEADIADYVTIGKDSVIYNNVKIGRYTYMQMHCNINNAIIGRFCSLGDNVLIGPWEHPIHYITTSPKVYRNILKISGGYDDTPKLTKIGNDVWIGSNSVILDGICIGDGAVIGASSVVTKDVPAYAIVVGNPARIINYRFSSKKIDYLKNMQWWNWDDDFIVSNKDFFI